MNNFLRFIYAPLRLRAFRWWLVACGGGNLLYILLMTTVIQVDVHSSFFYFANFLLPFILPHLLIGGFQWLIVRRYLARPQGWLSVIALECGISTLVGISFVQYYPTVMTLLLGLGSGLAGWLFFRDRVQQAVYWIVAAVATQLALYQIQTAFVASDPFLVLFGEFPTFQIYIFTAFLKASLMFALQGCFTGWVLAYFILHDKQMNLSTGELCDGVR